MTSDVSASTRQRVFLLRDLGRTYFADVRVFWSYYRQIRRAYTVDIEGAAWAACDQCRQRLSAKIRESIQLA